MCPDPQVGKYLCSINSDKLTFDSSSRALSPIPLSGRDFSAGVTFSTLSFFRSSNFENLAVTSSKEEALGFEDLGVSWACERNALREDFLVDRAGVSRFPDTTDWNRVSNRYRIRPFHTTYNDYGYNAYGISTNIQQNHWSCSNKSCRRLTHKRYQHSQCSIVSILLPLHQVSAQNKNDVFKTYVKNCSY